MIVGEEIRVRKDDDSTGPYTAELHRNQVMIWSESGFVSEREAFRAGLDFTLGQEQKK